MVVMGLACRWSWSTPSLLPEDECGAQQDPRHVDGRLQVLGVGELAVDAHADGDGCELRALRRRRPRCTDAVLAYIEGTPSVCIPE